MKKAIDYHPGMQFPAKQIYIAGSGKQYIVTDDVWICGFLIKKGFVFDGNSAPRFLFPIIAPDDCLAASCLHDWLYRDNGRKEMEARGMTNYQMRFYADCLWLAVQGAHGTSPICLNLGFKGLRWFGWYNFRKSKSLAIMPPCQNPASSPNSAKPS